MRPASGGSLFGKMKPQGGVLHRKGGAAAAGAGGVRIFDHETRADEFFGEVDCRICQKRQGDAVDDDLLAGPFEDHVIVFGGVQDNFILKA